MFETLRQQFATSGVGRWYLGREPGERKVVAGLALLVVAALVWLVVWQPVADWLTVEDNRYRNAQATLDWMRANEKTARAVARDQGGNATRRSLLPTITSLAQSHSLTLNRVQPESNGAVSVMLQGQQFNAVLRWLSELQQQHDVLVQRIAVDAEDQAGFVNAQVRLQ